MTNDLFNPEVERRYEASLALESTFEPLLWPRGCYGAANGWLMLVGPSPGRQDTDSDIWPGGPGRPQDSYASVGASAGVVAFDTNRARNARWNMLSDAVFGDVRYARALTSVANLDWGHNPDHHAIPASYLEQGCEVVAGLMKETKPRIVITLVKRTWEVLAPHLSSNFETARYVPATELDSLVIHLPGISVTTIVIRSPQHPSRHFFNSTHAATLRKEAQAFLASGGTQANEVSGSVAPVSTISIQLGHRGPRLSSSRKHQASTPVKRVAGGARAIRGGALMWSEQRPMVAAILSKHGYRILTDDQRVARVKGPGSFDERIAVHPKAGRLALYVRRGSERNLRQVAEDLGYPLKRLALCIEGLAVAQLDRVLTDLKDSLRRHPIEDTR